MKRDVCKCGRRNKIKKTAIVYICRKCKSLIVVKGKKTIVLKTLQELRLRGCRIKKGEIISLAIKMED